jgi:hypothetical protein
MDECGTKHIRHSLALPRDCTLSQNVIILVQTYGNSRSHLNHRRQLLRCLQSRDERGTKHIRHSLAFPRDTVPRARICWSWFSLMVSPDLI